MTDQDMTSFRHGRIGQFSARHVGNHGNDKLPAQGQGRGLRSKGGPGLRQPPGSGIVIASNDNFVLVRLLRQP